MKEPATPVDEIYRLDALRSLALLDTDPEAEFDAVTRLGQRLFAVPICLVSLIDENRQWFKSCAGLDAKETSRAISFCGHAILANDVFVIPDATQDERFHDNPLVTGAPFIRFYAGAPIRLPSGYTIGTVCLISPEPRTFGAEDQRDLAMLAEMALTAISVRALRAELDDTRAVVDRYQMLSQALTAPVAVADREGRIEDCNEAFAKLCAEAPQGRLLHEALVIPAVDWARRHEAMAVEPLVEIIGSLSVPLRIFADAQGFIVAPARTPDPLPSLGS